MGLAAVSISEVGTGGLNAEINIPGFGGNKITLKDLAIMSRQLATMIDSGLSLLRAADASSPSRPSRKPLAKVVGAGAQRRRGRYRVLRRRSPSTPDVFPPLMINMVKAGEVGGFLDQVLVSVADNFEAEVKLRGKIKSAMTYPVVVFVIAILAVIGMLLFIVPVFAGMFSSLGGELPLPTQILMCLSQRPEDRASRADRRARRLLGLVGQAQERPGGARARRPAEAQGARCSATLFRKIASPGSPATSAR